MPDSSGKLTLEEKQKVTQWIVEHWSVVTTSCPICGSKDWELSEHLVQPLTFSTGSVLVGGASYPQAMLISKKCGYTMYFNVMVMGIVQPPSFALKDVPGETNHGS